MYYARMIAPRGITLVELDHSASDQYGPHGIITVDCSNPREYDDGIAVEQLPWEEELYRVSVFAVDTSPLYRDGGIVKQALENTESRYEQIGMGRERYTPMLSEEIVKDFDFRQDRVRDSIAVSFMIGKTIPPTDVSIDFGRVEILQNFDYKDFGGRCKGHDPYKRFGRAAALILKHLAYSEERDEESVLKSLVNVSRGRVWRRGANINSAYMIGANYLMAKQMVEQDKLAIYRVHDPTNKTLTEVFGPTISTFSTEPGPHKGLGLDVYARYTSPLRRLEDFVMHGLLRSYAEGRQLKPYDHTVVQSAIRRLNQRVATKQFHGELKTSKTDVWGDERPQLRSVS